MNRTSTANRLAVVAIATALAVTGVACSDDKDGSDSALQPPTQIVVTQMGGQAPDSSAESSADLAIAPGWYVEYEFEVVGDLGPLPSDDTALHWPMGGSVAIDTVAKLAARLGVPGTPTVGTDGVLYSVGPTDGSAPSLTVYDDALLSWNMSGPWNTWPAGAGDGRDEVFGVLYSAGGSLARPVPTGPFPLIDLDEAIERLETLWGGGFGVMPMPAIDEPVAGSIDGGDQPVTGPAEDQPVIDPPVVDPQIDAPEPMVERIGLVSVEATRWTVWAEDGAMWQVPAYRFLDADGIWYDVPAISAEFLVIEDRRGVIEPDPGTVDDQMIDIDDAQVLVGLPVDEAEAIAMEMGWELRVIRLDGEDLLATTDFVTNRLNLEVADGDVVAIISVG